MVKSIVTTASIGAFIATIVGVLLLLYSLGPVHRGPTHSAASLTTTVAPIPTCDQHDATMTFAQLASGQHTSVSSAHYPPSVSPAAALASARAGQAANAANSTSTTAETQWLVSPQYPNGIEVNIVTFDGGDQGSGAGGPHGYRPGQCSSIQHHFAVVSDATTGETLFSVAY